MVKGKAIGKATGVIGRAAEAAKLGGAAVALERATDVIDNQLVNTIEGGLIGWAATGGNPLGAVGGGLVGFVLADGERIMPVDMIAVPAYQYSMILQGKEPTFQIYIKEGELVTPIMPTDMMISEAIVEAPINTPTKRKRAKGAGLPKKYAKMGFKKGWREYKKTSAYKKKKASKKRRR